MSWSKPAFEAVAGLVSTRTGLTFTQRESSAELGIRRAMARAGESDADSYLGRLAHEDAVLDDLLNELTVGETYFFREPGQFQLIRAEVLPDIRRRWGAEHVIRAWSAGCASGEEAYSLAIVFEQEGLGNRAHVLGTDISQKALSTARRGMCSNWSLRGENGADALPFLVRTRSAYRVADAIRKRVTFAALNLAVDAYPSFVNGTWGMDLILCRNVLIYFDRATVANVARRLFESLSEGGWLIAASSDPPLWDFAPFEVVAAPQGIFYRKMRGAARANEDERAEAKDLLAVWDEWRHADNAARSQGPDVSDVGQITPAYAETPVAEIGHVGDTGADAALPQPALAQGSPLRLLANQDPAQALVECGHMLVDQPFSTELNYLHAVLLMDAGREDQAIASMRKVIYLDRSLAVAHFTLAAMLRQRGDRDGARRGYRNCRDLCAARPADELLPLGEGERAGPLAELAGAELAFLEDGA